MRRPRSHLAQRCEFYEPSDCLDVDDLGTANSVLTEYDVVLTDCDLVTAEHDVDHTADVGNNDDQRSDGVYRGQPPRGGRTCSAVVLRLSRRDAAMRSNDPEALSDLSERASDLVLLWWRGQDLNLRPSGYEPDELPSCSTPRRVVALR